MRAHTNRHKELFNNAICCENDKKNIRPWKFHFMLFIILDVFYRCCYFKSFIRLTAHSRAKINFSRLCLEHRWKCVYRAKWSLPMARTSLVSLVHASSKMPWNEIRTQATRESIRVKNKDVIWHGVPTRIYVYQIIVSTRCAVTNRINN